MTREEAIEYNKNLREYMRITDKKSEYKFLKENYEALEMAIQALEQEPKWIPVTERLPEEGQMVIACYPTDCGKRVMTAYYYKECGFSCGITYAWMPLPKPYKEDKE